MRKIQKIFLVLVIILTILSLFNISFARIEPDDYQPSGPTSNDYTKAFFKASIVLGAIRNVSVVVSVITLMIIGVKYIIGSAEERADYKKTMIPYIIGCVLASSGTTLVCFIYNSLNG